MILNKNTVGVYFALVGQLRNFVNVKKDNLLCVLFQLYQMITKAVAVSS